MGKVALCVMLTFLGCRDRSSATPSQGSAADSGKGSATSKPRPKFEVNSYCLTGGNTMVSPSTGRKGHNFTLSLMVPLEGTETVTEASKPLRPSEPVTEKAGDKKPLRILVTVSCSAFLPDVESIADALKDEREGSSCQASSLNLAALEAGKPFSMVLSPSVEPGWQIRAITPGFTSIEIGGRDGKNLRVTGIVPYKLDKDSYYNLENARISWDYAEGDGGPSGSSRVELAADCPKP
jgi:hypothetical protein